MFTPSAFQRPIENEQLFGALWVSRYPGVGVSRCRGVAVSGSHEGGSGQTGYSRQLLRCPRWQAFASDRGLVFAQAGSAPPPRPALDPPRQEYARNANQGSDDCRENRYQLAHLPELQILLALCFGCTAIILPLSPRIERFSRPLDLGNALLHHLLAKDHSLGAPAGDVAGGAQEKGNVAKVRLRHRGDLCPRIFLGSLKGASPCSQISDEAVSERRIQGKRSWPGSLPVLELGVRSPRLYSARGWPIRATGRQVVKLRAPLRYKHLEEIPGHAQPWFAPGFACSAEGLEVETNLLGCLLVSPRA